LCEEYRLFNKRTHLNKYAIPLLEEIFDALGQANVFSTIDLIFSCYQLPLKEGDKVKMTFCGIDHQVLARLSFAKCYIDDIIVFNPTSKDHKHHL
jgi:hypothetical protein